VAFDCFHQKLFARYPLGSCFSQIRDMTAMAGRRWS
jgi:hypothetical protein